MEHGQREISILGPFSNWSFVRKALHARKLKAGRRGALSALAFVSEEISRRVADGSAGADGADPHMRGERAEGRL